MADIAPIAINLHQISLGHLRLLPLVVDVIVVEGVGLLPDFGPRFRLHFVHVAVQVLQALVHFVLEALVESDEVLVVERALDFDIFAVHVGGGPGPVAVFIVAGHFGSDVRFV